jgi:predicted AlkP superfamily pyrophosphatase or phosphodiesterase
MRCHALMLPILFAAVMASSAWAGPKVLVLGVDGCRPDALAVANTPYLDALADSGAASYDARNTMTHGSSGPNWSSAMTGVDVPKHGVTSNSWNATEGFVGNHFDQYPHMFSYIEALDPSLYTASFAGWPPINPGTWADRFADETQALGQSGNTARVVDLLTNADPDVIFIQMEGVDSAGHADAFSPTSATYLAAIEQADADVGSMLNAVYTAAPAISTAARTG